MPVLSWLLTPSAQLYNLSSLSSHHHLNSTVVGIEQTGIRIDLLLLLGVFFSPFLLFRPNGDASDRRFQGRELVLGCLFLLFFFGFWGCIFVLAIGWTSMVFVLLVLLNL